MVYETHGGVDIPFKLAIGYRHYNVFIVILMLAIALSIISRLLSF